MQPRSRLSPRYNVFHVTKSGCSAVSTGAFSFRNLFPREKKLLLLELLLVAELASLTALLGVDTVLWTEEELVVEGEGARRRDIAAGRWFSAVTVPEVDCTSSSSESEGSRSASISTSSSVGSALYCFQKTSTWWRDRGARFSRLADRDSKQ